MREPFEEIRITDLDVDMTQPSQEAPGFRQERRFPPHRTWRNAWVIGRHIVVECIPEELEQFQLNHLKEDASTVNKKCLECGAARKAEIWQQLQEQAKARRDLENLRTRLRFD